MSLPEVLQNYHALGGGLDMLTPAIAIPEGKCIDAQNYEPEISGGYRRIDGYERYDGHARPSSAGYWVMQVAITGALSVGQVITGATSSATAKVLAIDGAKLVLGRVSSTFLLNEPLTVSAVAQATALSTADSNGEPSAQLDADYSAMAANDLRLDILMVPGSGPIRGVWVYKDVVYAFRDNAGATAGAMYKATSAGWVLVSFGTEIKFNSATGGNVPFAVGGVIGNAASPTKTATVLAVLLRAGTMGTDGVGTLVIVPLTGSFSNADPIYEGATQRAVATSAATPITRLPGGRLSFVNSSFSSSTDSLKMYGSDGVNLAFEFDGTNYIPIRTGMAQDTPSYIMAHRFYLFLSFRGSVQLSALGNPYAWTAILGAAEIALADDVTGFLPQGGNNAGSSMAIFTRSRTYILYGSSTTNFNLVLSVYELGYSAFTMQPVSNNTFGLTARGIQGLITTLTYGDFDYASVAHDVNPFMVARRGMETASTSLRAKDQYRLYYSDGYCLVLGLTGDKVNGVMPINYGRPVRCIATSTLASGSEVTYFGSDDGYVYQDSIGTSQDGDPIEAWVRMPFNHLKSPQVRKRYRRAVLQVKANGYCTVNIAYDIGYASPNALPSATSPDKALTGGGGYWDQFTWDQFTWDAAVVEEPVLSIEGTEKNISFLFYSRSANFKSHVLQGLSLAYTPQRQER